MKIEWFVLAALVGAGFVAIGAQEKCPVNPNVRGHENVEWSIGYAFHLTDAKKDLPRVLLVGDSICNGYQGEVARLLEGKMNVSYWASSYCVTSPAYLKFLDAYLSEAKYDVVHFNNGCHSFSTQTVPWQNALRESLALIRKRQPQAKIVWASTTPNRNDVKNENVRRLNAAALPVVRDFAVATNDLYGVMDKLDATHRSGDVWRDDYHFNPGAIRVQAEAIVRCLNALPSLELAPLFTDGMVLAADHPVRVFGTGRGNVRVAFRGHEAKCVAAGDRPWCVELPAGAAGGPFEMRIVLDGRERVLHNVHVGAVILFAGQSNMQFKLRESTTPASEWKGDARIRSFSTVRPEGIEPFAPSNGWVTLTAENAGQWSAVAYETATRLAAARNIAVGVVNCYQGASTIQAWMDPEETAKPRYRIPEGGALHGDHTHAFYGRWNQPHGQLYRRQFLPLVPFAFTSVVWYQGESNTGRREGEVYAGLLTAMMRRWREDLGEPDLPFVIVQLADLDWRKDADWRAVQRAQADAVAQNAHAVLVRCADVCEKDNIHPKTKSRLGARIAEALETCVPALFPTNAVTETVFVDSAAAAGGDGTAARPFASLAGALARVRQSGRGERSVTLRFKAGNYFLPQGLKLEAADSHLRFVGERGVRFTRAEKATPGGIVKCDAARPPDSETYYRMAPHAPMFFYDGKWAVEARWPNEDWAQFTAKDVVDSGLRSRCLSGITPDKPTVPGSFRFANDRPAKWDFDAGVWLVGYTTHDWSFERVRLASYTPSNRLVRLAGSVPYGLATGSWSEYSGRRFYICGAKSELDAPGEYFYDRRTGRVDFISPKEGMREFLAVTREGPIVSVEGSTDVTFEGIDFAYACGEGLRLQNATNVVVRDSTIRNVGGDGVVMTGGRGCRVERTEIVHCGFGGVRISAGDRRTLTCADHVVTDCEIHDFSRICRTYQPAVRVLGCGVTVCGCRIHNAPHSGVIYGGNEHLFENNELWNILWESGDAGAFYTGRDPTSRGNVLRGNYVHDIGHPERGSVNTMAFYIDDCDAGDTIVSNRIVNVPRGVMLGGGHDNHLIGNAFERCNLAISVDARGVAWNDRWDSKTDRSWQMTRKVKEMPVATEPWKSRYPLLVNYLNDHPREPRHISIVGNRFTNCKRIWEWGMGAEKYLDLIERRDNGVTDKDR